MKVLTAPPDNKMKIFTAPPVTKRKRFNKNKKKAWRKKIDISDVEEIMEEKRREERTGGPLGEQSFDNLFIVDSTTNTNKSTKKKVTKNKKFEPLSPGMKPTLKRKEKKLKCQEFIHGLPGAKAIAVKKGIQQQKTTRIMKLAMKLRENTPKASIKKKSIAEQRKKSKEKAKKKFETPSLMEDIWSREEKKELKMFGEVGKTYMEAPMAYYKEQTKTKKPKIPEVLYKKPSALPAVMIPKPGQSYNPSFEAHQELLSEVAKEREAKKQLKEREIRLNKKYIPNKKDGITQQEYMKEMSEGIAFLNADQEHTGEEIHQDIDEENNNCISMHKIQEKKSKQTRKKAIKLKIEEQKRLTSKQTNQRESKILYIKSFMKEFAEDDLKKKKLNLKKKMKKNEQKFQTQKLSQHKFKEEDILFTKQKDLASSMRTITTAGNPLLMRYKHLQRRNIIDTRVRVKKVKAKSKEVVKKPYKEEVGHMLSQLKADGIII